MDIVKKISFKTLITCKSNAWRLSHGGVNEKRDNDKHSTYYCNWANQSKNKCVNIMKVDCVKCRLKGSRSCVIMRATYEKAVVIA